MAASFLGKPENLRVLYRTGQHNPITVEQRRQNIDWLDLSFGRGTAKQSDFPEQFIHKFDWQAWKAELPPEQLTVPFPAPQARDNPDRNIRIRWALGQAPRKISWDGTYTFLTEVGAEQEPVRPPLEERMSELRISQHCMRAARR